MAQLFHAGGALRQDFSMAREATDTSAAGADIFVDTAARAPSCLAMHPDDFFDKAAKPWVLPALCSVVFHLLLFALLLFAPKLAWLRPAWGVAENRFLAVALVAMPTAGAAVQSPASAPLAPPARPKRQTPQKPVALKPSAAMTARPQFQPPADPADAKSAALDSTSTDMALPADERAPTASTAGPGTSSTEQAAVSASVPLYDLNPPPIYPAAARGRNMQGTVLLAVLVDREGRAAQVRLAQGSGHDLLDRSALQSVRQWRFAPARRMGQPQEMWVQVPVRFQLQ